MSHPNQRHPRPSRLTHESRPRPLATALCSALLVLAGGTLAGPAASAADGAPLQARQYRIPAGPLAQVLGQFAAEAGIALSFDASRLEGMKSPGLSGSHTPEDGFAILLQGSGYAAVGQGGGKYIVQRLPDVPPATLSAVTVTSQAESIYTTPHAVFSVSREKLDRVPQTSTGDIFKGVPGVLAGNVRNGVSIEPNIRGMQGMGRVKVLVDGTEAVSSAYKGYGGNRDHSFVDPDFLAGFDVEKGPVNGAYGGGAIGGAVRMHTLSADDLLTDPDKQWAIQIKGMYGNNTSDDLERTRYCATSFGARGEACRNGTTWTDPRNGRVYDDRREHSSGSYADKNYAGSIIGAWRPFDRLELVAGLSERLSGNYASGKRGTATYVRAGNPQKRDIAAKQPGEEVLSHQDTSTYLLKGKLYLPADQTLEAGYNHYRSTFGEVRDTEYCLVVGNIEDCFPPPSETSQKRYSLSHGWQPDSPWWNLKTELWYVETEELRGPNYQDNDVETLGLRMHNTSRLDLPWFPLSLNYGGQWTQEKTAVASSRRNSASVVQQNDIRGEPAGKTTQYAFFGNLTLPVNGWLTLNGGGRYDHFKMTRSRTDERPTGYTSPVTDDEESEVSFNYGLTVEPMQGMQFYARYSEGWRAPSMRENLLSSVDNSAEGLEPERSKSIDLGMNLAFANVLRDGDKLGVKLGWFDSKYTNYIYGNGAFLVFFDNIPRFHARGEELSLNYDAGWMFAEYALTHYSKAEACYRMLNQLSMPMECINGVGRSGLDPMALPRTSQYLTAGLRLLNKSLVVGVNVNKTSDPLMGTDRINRYHWQEYTIYDLFGSYRVNKSLDVGVSVENLRDTFYVEAGTNMINLPSPGRTARLTATLKF